MVDFPKSKWLSNWGIDKLNAQYIDKLIKNIPNLSEIEIMENAVTGFIYKGK